MLMERGLLGAEDENGTGDGTDDDDGGESDNASTSSSAGGAGGGSRAPSLHFAADLADDGALPGEEGFGFAPADGSWRGDDERDEEEEGQQEMPPPPPPQQQHRRLPSPHPLPPASRLAQLAKPQQPGLVTGVLGSPEAAAQPRAHLPGPGGGGP